MTAIRVLVTGGAGYIGSHTCKALAAAGHVPVVFDNLENGHRSAVRWGPLIQGDLADKALVRAALRDHAIGAVLHFAGYAYVGESMRQPGRYFRNNAFNTLTLLDAMQAEGVPAIVFSSTCATYGIPEGVPIDETHPQRPVNPYGESKLFAERAMHWYHQAHGIRHACLRYFNAAGADLEGELGEEHDPETHLIPLVIQAALGLRPEVGIFGTDYDTPDGTAIRDFIHVDDLARAHVSAVARLIGGAAPMCVNLGTGIGHSVLDVIRAVEDVTGLPVPVREEARRPGDPPVLVAATRTAQELLGWSAQCSSLATIVDSAARWHSANARRHHTRALSLESR